MHTVLSIFVVVAYGLVLTFVAVRARAARDFTQFSLAGRAIPLALIFGSLCATYVGPGFSIGFVGKGYKSGFLFLGIGLAYTLQNILVGLFVAPRLRALPSCHTLGDAIGQKYDRKCQILAGIISVSVCTLIAAVMAHAGAVVLNDIFGLSAFWSAAIVVSITALYTTFGGLRASIITDAFQFTAFTILLPVTLLLALGFHFSGGAVKFASDASAATSVGLGSMSGIKIAGLLAAFFLGETLIPPYANRALASKTTRVSRNGFILAGLFSVVWFVIMLSLGVIGRTIVPEVGDEDKVLLNLVRAIMPVEGYMLLLVILVSVIMSSLDSLLNAGAVAFTEDIVKPFARLSDKSSLNVGRFATVIIAAIAAGLAVFVPSIIAGLLICYTIWASAILPALIIGLWAKRPHPLAAVLSMSVGILIAMIAIIFMFRYPNEIEVIIIPGIFVAVLAYALGHWIGSFREEGKQCE